MTTTVTTTTTDEPTTVLRPGQIDLLHLDLGLDEEVGEPRPVQEHQATAAVATTMNTSRRQDQAQLNAWPPIVKMSPIGQVAAQRPRAI